MGAMEEMVLTRPSFSCHAGPTVMPPVVRLRPRPGGQHAREGLAPQRHLHCILVEGRIREEVIRGGAVHGRGQGHQTVDARRHATGKEQRQAVGLRVCGALLLRIAVGHQLGKEPNGRTAEGVSSSTRRVAPPQVPQ